MAIYKSANDEPAGLVYTRPTICIPASKQDADFVRNVFEKRYKSTEFEVEGGPVETGKNVGKGFFAWFITYAPGKNSDFHPALLKIFDSIENGTGGKLELGTYTHKHTYNPIKPFWHLCRSNFPNHNMKKELVKEPEIQFGDFE